MKNLFAFVLAFSFIGCTSMTVASKDPILNMEDLTEGFAKERAANIKNVSYDLNLFLTKTETSYTGTQKIQFDLKENKDVYFDFQEGEITKVLINGKSANLERGPILTKIPKEYLRQEANIVILEFTHLFSRSGAGLHRFVDPEDQNVYTYTDFQPYDASRMAPFFDQPDIRAPLGLTVTAPADWIVVANGKSFSNEQFGENKKWKFTRSEPIATYLYAVMAGPYVFKEARYGKMPIRLFSRQTMAKHMPYDEWFQITRQGLSFYENYFQTKYPFQKYDQLLVPEFNSGAMENVGAVTFTEKYVKQGNMTRSDRLHFYNVVLHEMAHQWFGDLVTMRWWNDLWLNESFATFMAPLAQASATQYKEAWLYFRSDKTDAYIQDMSSTTHPIAAVVNNTNEAYTNFDDITYGKGASVLRELYFYLGAQNFQRGLRQYFKTYAWKNTELKDFIGTFETPNLQGLNDWFQLWLETTSADRVTASVTCDVRTQKLSFTFSGEKLRPHALKVARFTTARGALVDLGDVELKRRPQDVKETQASIETSGQPCPQFVYPNSNDQGYLLVDFSENDLQFLETYIGQIQNDTTRMAIWSELWQHVRDGKLSLARFSKLAQTALAKETNLEILNLLLDQTVQLSNMNSVYAYWPKNTPEEMTGFLNEAKNYENILQARMKQASARSDLAKILTEGWIDSVVTNEGYDQLKSVVTTIQDTDLRWAAILSVCGNDIQTGQKLAAAEVAHDASDYARKNALVCRVKNPDLKEKNYWISELSHKKFSYSADEIRRISSNLFSGLQRPQIGIHQGQIFKALSETWPELDEAYQYRIVTGLAPVYCDEKAHQELSDFVGKNSALPATIRQPLAEKLDEDKICLNVAKALKSTQK